MSDEIAIVGVGCRFPGAENLEEFWRVLVKGENHVLEVDNERWNFDDYYDPDVHTEGKTSVNRAGLLEDIDKWDNQLFGVSDNEAKVVDPQQRLVLDCCHMAMEDAGITRKKLDGSQTSVYVGAMNDDFKARKNNFTAEDSAFSVTGIFRSILSARVSYTFNLKGPCMVVDTACSSSLVAIHLACQSLKLKESEMAFAGGVSVLLDPSPFVPLSKARMLSPTGQCQTFTADANGYARGEGCGMVILQRLEDALQEGNNIWGVIKTGTNQDGRMVSPMTAPSGVQQLELLQHVYKGNDDDRNAIQVIEAHGTGTPIGDPTEVNALGEFFKDSETAKRNNILIGSVKTNIGHLESAAGVAGLIKVVLMMRHEKIVPSVMYSEKKRNPKLDFKNFNFVVPTNVIDWGLNSNKSRIACVNSFGFGGSNSHLLIKQWLSKTEVTVSNNNGHLRMSNQMLLVISSLDKAGLVKNLTQFQMDIEKTFSSLGDIAMTSMCRRDHFKHRAALIFSSKEDLKKQCQSTIKRLENKKQPGALRFVYVFCGVGTTWKGMCYELLQNQIFKTAVMSVDKRLQKYTGWSITHKWKNKEDVSDSFVSHLSIFVCQIGLTAIWKALGIKPDAVVGQSVGEVAACYAAGIIDEDSAVKIIYQRSLLLSQCKSGGMMVVRNIKIEKVQTMCKKIGKVNIAVYISPLACTVAGEKEALLRLESCFREDQNAILKTLDVSCGYHSPIVETAGNKLQTCLTGSIKGTRGPSCVPMISTVHGKEVSQSDYCKASYWKDNIIKPVRFHDAISQAVDNKEYTVFIEIGPSPVLQVHSSDIIPQTTGYAVFPSVGKGKELSTLLQSFANVYELGGKMDFCTLFENERKFQPTLLPRYVFNKNSFPLPKEYEIKKNSDVKEQSKRKHKYIFMKDQTNKEDYMEIRISPETTPYVYQHFVRETIIVPGALYADIGFEVGRQLLQLEPDQLNVTLDFLKAVPTSKNESLSMKVRVKENVFEGIGFSFRVDYHTETVCKGSVKEVNATAKANYAILDALCLELQQKVTSSEIYSTLQTAGFRYGPQLTVLRDGVKNEKKSLLATVVTNEVLQESNQWYIHPCILDGMLQTTVVFTSQENPTRESNAESTQFLPVGMDSLKIAKSLTSITQNTRLRILTEKVSETQLETMKKQHFNIYLLDGYGFILAEIKNFTMYAANRQMKCCDDLRYTLTWRPLKDERKQLFGDGSESKVVIINANEILSAYCKKAMHTVELCDFGSTFSTENERILDQKLKKCSTLMVFFGSSIKYLNDAQLIFDTVSKNIKFLRWLILFLMKLKCDKPELFLLTEGVHSEHYPENYVKDVSLVGSEIWGFFRNMEVEFAYSRMNMIDIASLSNESLKTLWKVMSKPKKGKQPNGREFLICGKDVYEVHIHSSSKRYRMPMLRCHNKQYPSYTSNSYLCSSKRYLLDEPFLIYTETKEEVLYTSEEPSVDFEVEKICIHDSNLYPVTHVDWSGNFNIQTQKEDESGYKVMAIEMIGRLCSPSNRQKLYGAFKKSHEDNELYVACFPTVTSRFLKVPKGCFIKLKDIQSYKPGFVLTTLLLWEVLRDVPNDSEIYIMKSDLAAEAKTLIQGILKTKKKFCVVHIVDGIIKLDPDSKAVALVLQSTDVLEAYDFLKQFRLIFGLSYCLPDALKEKLIKLQGAVIKTVDPKSIIENKQLVKKIEDIRSFLCNFKAAHPSERMTKPQRGFGFSLREFGLCSNLTSEEEKTQCKIKVSQNNLFDKMATYIVVGGLTGVGWMIVEVLAEKGAGIIVTIGRRACSSEMEAEFRRLQKAFQCKVVHYKVSVSNSTEVISAIEDIQTKFKDHPIRGVFQGAGVIRSATIENLTHDHIDAVLAPKILGTLNLHNATKHLNLDYFVILSSISSIVGAIGQSNYGAANSFIDAFADNRRQRGYKCQAINWGAIASGMAVVENVAKDLELRGHIHLKREEFRSCFIHCLMTNESNVIYANLDYDTLLTYFTAPDMTFHGKKLAFLWDYKYGSGMDNNDNTNKRFDKELIKGLKVEEQKNVVQDMLKHIFSAATAKVFEDGDFGEPFVAMGIDSMATITIVSLIRSNFGVTFKSEIMLDPSSTIEKLASMVVTELNNLE